jgi:beta-galactosidase/beta-glucuronidase
MKRIIILFLVSFITAHVFSQDWTFVKGKLTTPWTDQVDPQHPLPEYPRPQMARSTWMNLNGLWDYNILPKSDQNTPSSFNGKILVPYPVESSLSGVSTTVGKDSVLWYHKTFELPAAYRKGNVLLHFGAVDWFCEVFVNGKFVNNHSGGYDPFTCDITTSLKKGSRQEISVRVWDPSDDGPQPRGKQVKQPHSIWYTSVTGIWQTVWIEPVPLSYIVSTKQTPDVDHQSVKLSAQIYNSHDGDQVVVAAWNGNQKIAEQSVGVNDEASLNIPNPRLWAPGHPFLYDLTVTLKRN